MKNTDDLSIIFNPPFDVAIEKLEQLMCQSKRAFLIGAGCSKCAGLPLMLDLTTQVLKHVSLSENTKNIMHDLKAAFEGSENINIEDYLSELIDWVAVAERRNLKGAKNSSISLNANEYTGGQLRDAVEQIKMLIAGIIDVEVDIDLHRKFVQMVHNPIRDGRNESYQSVDYLCLNYDTLLEDALALEKIQYSDGMMGGATGWWDIECFSRKDLQARVLKLHGSINWSEIPDDPLPRRIGKGIKTGDNIRHVLIWPASTKYRETQLDPYAQLSRLAQDILKPSEQEQLVLFVLGYRFSDTHINFEVDRCLRQSKGRLTVVAFTSDDMPKGQLKEWNDDPNISEQVLIFANKGFFHGDTKLTSDEVSIPWWKFENIIRIMAGER